MAVPKGKLSKVSDHTPIVIKSDPIKGDRGDEGPQGLSGAIGSPGLDGRDGTNAPLLGDIISSLMASESFLEAVKGEKGDPGLGAGGGAGKLDVADLPGYRSASPGDILAVSTNGKVGFLDLGDIAMPEYDRLIDTEGDYKYIGEADPGTATSATGWRIKRANFKAGDDTDITWGDGSSEFNKIWDDRTGYAY